MRSFTADELRKAWKQFYIDRGHVDCGAVSHRIVCGCAGIICSTIHIIYNIIHRRRCKQRNEISIIRTDIGVLGAAGVLPICGYPNRRKCFIFSIQPRESVILFLHIVCPGHAPTDEHIPRFSACICRDGKFRFIRCGCRGRRGSICIAARIRDGIISRRIHRGEIRINRTRIDIIRRRKHTPQNRRRRYQQKKRHKYFFHCFFPLCFGCSLRFAIDNTNAVFLFFFAPPPHQNSPLGANFDAGACVPRHWTCRGRIIALRITVLRIARCVTRFFAPTAIVRFAFRPDARRPLRIGPNGNRIRPTRCRPFRYINLTRQTQTPPRGTTRRTGRGSRRGSSNSTRNRNPSRSCRGTPKAKPPE